MKVQDLIEELQKMNPENEVFIDTGIGTYTCDGVEYDGHTDTVNILNSWLSG